MNNEHNFNEIGRVTASSQNYLPEEQEEERRLRVLHDFLYEATSFPGLATPYTSFLRSLRERLHPAGVQEIRLAEMDSGLKFQVDIGDRLGCDIYYGYYQEYFDAQLLFNLLDAGSIFLDIGANFGYYALTAAKLTGQNSFCHAFEPNEYAYQLLQNNVKINGFQEIVHCHKTSVGAEDGETDFYIFTESSFSGISSTGRAKLRQKVKVPICCLDSILPQLELPWIDAMKIDVEGHEFSVLRGAMETLKQSPNLVIMMEICAKNLDEQKRKALISVLTDIYELDFRGWVVEPTQETLRAITTPQEATSLKSANLFLVVAHSERERRLQQAYHDLRVNAFRGLAQQIGLSAEILLARNTADPYGYSKLHSALLEKLVREQELTINSLNAQRQKLMLKLTGLQTTQETQNRQFLQEIQMQREKIKTQREKIKTQREKIKTQREQMSEKEQRLVKLQEEVNRPLKVKILEKIKQKLKIID